MALANFQKAISEITGRAGNVFVLDLVPDPDHWTSVGIVKNLHFKAEPLVTEPDTTGRIFQYGFAVEITMMLMQSTLDRLGDISDLIDTSTNGITFKITDRPAAEADLASSQGADSATGIRLDNCMPTVAPEMNYSDAESGIAITIKGNVELDAFDSFGVTGGTLTFDA